MKYAYIHSIKLTYLIKNLTYIYKKIDTLNIKLISDIQYKIF